MLFCSKPRLSVLGFHSEEYEGVTFQGQEKPDSAPSDCEVSFRSFQYQIQILDAVTSYAPDPV